MVVDATVLGEADFAGAAGGDALVADLHRILERAQGVGVQFRRGEALVAGKAAAVDTFRHHHFPGAAFDDIDQALGLAQVLGAAGDVDGHRLVLGGELQALQQVAADEAHRVEQLQPRIQAVLDQAQGTGAGVAVDRVEAAAAGMQ
ncbi:hypothetical protein D3C78_1551630 [compost metagenome]